MFKAICAALLNAPTFNGECWRAERDDSIRARADRTACEFVSPILSGSDGVQHLIEFVEWAKAIDVNVNASCGCHITVGTVAENGPCQDSWIRMFQLRGRGRIVIFPLISNDLAPNFLPCLPKFVACGVMALYLHSP